MDKISNTASLPATSVSEIASPVKKARKNKKEKKAAAALVAAAVVPQEAPEQTNATEVTASLAPTKTKAKKEKSNQQKQLLAQPLDDNVAKKDEGKAVEVTKAKKQRHREKKSQLKEEASESAETVAYIEISTTGDGRVINKQQLNKQISAENSEKVCNTQLIERKMFNILYFLRWFAFSWFFALIMFFRLFLILS